MSKGKVQKNGLGVNVLVSTTESNNRHYSHLNKSIKVEKVLSDDEILELWETVNEEDRIDLMKDWLKFREGYAVSNCKEHKNLACHSLEDIKMYMICILSMRCSEKQLKAYLCALSDWSGISDITDWATDSDNTATAIWLDKSMEFLTNKRRDLWVEYFKKELIKLEDYEKINALNL